MASKAANPWEGVVFEGEENIDGEEKTGQWESPTERERDFSEPKTKYSTDALCSKYIDRATETNITPSVY